MNRKILGTVLLSISFNSAAQVTKYLEESYFGDNTGPLIVVSIIVVLGLIFSFNATLRILFFLGSLGIPFVFLWLGKNVFDSTAAGVICFVLGCYVWYKLLKAMD